MNLYICDGCGKKDLTEEQVKMLCLDCQEPEKEFKEEVKQISNSLSETEDKNEKEVT